MATLAKTSPGGRLKGGDNRRTVTGEQFAEALRPWGARLAMRQVVSWTANGVMVGLLVGSVLLLISRFVPWAGAMYWAGAVVAGCLLCGLGLAIAFRPSPEWSVRLLDARLGLRDRLSTAWELREDSGSLPALQRRDALRKLEEYTPAGAITLWPGRARVIALALLVVAFALLLLLPNPQLAALQQREAFQASISRQVKSIEQLSKEIDGQGTIPAQLRQQIEKILQQALAQLQQASNSNEAQQILTQAQGKLNQLRNPQASTQAQAQAAASQSLQSSSNANLKAAGTALVGNDLKSLKNALQKLTSSLNGMTPAQRSQLAQQIESAANQAGGDPQLSAALHQLAKAVADGTSSDISDATKAVENAVAQESASQSATKGIDKASQSLQQAANSLTASTDNSTSGKITNGSGQQPGPGQTNKGQGQGSGQSQTPGQGTQGTSGQGSSGSKTGKSEQVYVPGQQSTGTSSITSDGGSGTVQQGTDVSYAQVLALYMQMAHDQIDNSAIPPDLKALVQEYYNSLEGQK